MSNFGVSGLQRGVVPKICYCHKFPVRDTGYKVGGSIELPVIHTEVLNWGPDVNNRRHFLLSQWGGSMGTGGEIHILQREGQLPKW